MYAPATSFFGRTSVEEVDQGESGECTAGKPERL
jgi:hypothetical protein